MDNKKYLFSENKKVAKHQKKMVGDNPDKYIQKIIENVSNQVEPPVKPAFGGLTVIERKELECIWNGKTNYGKHPMNYQRFLEAGLEIIIGCTNASQKSV